MFRLEGLPKQASYFPISKAKYDMVVGARNLNFDLFGNGEQDARVFQIDRNFLDYLSSKRKSRKEYFDKCIGFHGNYSKIEEQVTGFLITRLTKEYPDFFELSYEKDTRRLFCRLTNDTLFFDDNGKLVSANTSTKPNYSSSLDALTSQVQEDIAIHSFDADREFLSAVHVCMPAYWVPKDKLGKNFMEVHSPVPGFYNAFGKYPLEVVLRGKTFVRFAWGLSTDDCLGHIPSDESDNQETFNPNVGNLYLRVERQTINPLPEINSFIFTIRPYIYYCDDLTSEQKSNLASAIKTMSAETLRYKGLAGNSGEIINWLNSFNL